MFVVKLTAFLCILVEANAYTRNEGNEYRWMKGFKAAPSSKEESDKLDTLSWTVFGYTVSEMQTMYSQNNFGKLLTKDNVALSEFKKKILENNGKSTEERLLALSVYYVLGQLASGAMSRSEAMAHLDETYGKMSKKTQDEWNKDFGDLFGDQLKRTIGNK